METQVQRIHPDGFETGQLAQACRILQEGGLVAFPTETVYGLGGDALCPEAAAKIYRAKGRPSDNPLIVHIAEAEALEDIAEEIPEAARRLAKQFWPGPLTMIFPKTQRVPLSTTGGLETVAVRMPSHPVAAALIRESGIYVAAPSANISGRPSPTRAEHVLEDLDGRIDMIIDGGAVGIGLESTIVDMSTETPAILRPGAVTGNMLEEAAGCAFVDVTTDAVLHEPAVPRAPGMKYRHYAPKGELVIVEGETALVVDKINSLVKEKQALGCRVGVIATQETQQLYQCELVRSIGSFQKEGSIAAGLYNILREMDYLDAEFIFTESFAQDSLGGAIMNRMCKAAAGHVVSVRKGR